MTTTIEPHHEPPWWRHTLFHAAIESGQLQHPQGLVPFRSSRPPLWFFSEALLAWKANAEATTAQASWTVVDPILDQLDALIDWYFPPEAARELHQVALIIQEVNVPTNVPFPQAKLEAVIRGLPVLSAAASSL